jgi:flagellar operon protein
MSSNLLVPNISRPIDVSVNRANETPRPVKGEFESLLKGQTEAATSNAAPLAAPPKLKFSNHAMERIRDRGIHMDAGEAGRLEKAVESAAAKGSRDALVLTKDAAFIVSVQNKTVVTAMDRAALNGNVFTNIDSTIVI